MKLLKGIKWFIILLLLLNVSHELFHVADILLTTDNKIKEVCVAGFIKGESFAQSALGWVKSSGQDDRSESRIETPAIIFSNLIVLIFLYKIIK